MFVYLASHLEKTKFRAFAPASLGEFALGSSGEHGRTYENCDFCLCMIVALLSIAFPIFLTIVFAITGCCSCLVDGTSKSSQSLKEAKDGREHL